MTQLLKYKSGKMTALSVIAFTATIVAMLASCDTAQLEIPEVQLTLRLSLPETGEYIIRKSKFPQNPKRSVRFSGKRTKRSVQKRKARNTQKAETKVL